MERVAAEEEEIQLPWERGVRMLNTAGLAARTIHSGTKILTNPSGANQLFFFDPLLTHAVANPLVSTQQPPTKRSPKNCFQTLPNPFTLSTLLLLSFLPSFFSFRM